ncbi:MAG: ankyrin repeat domain-containing protein [Gemmatimonadaceae bacterium]|nr:ankyrin repeat domain-containing protein [Gemmatimonadaceae bacterium]
MSALRLAAARGRDDVLRAMVHRGATLPSDGPDALLVACALDDADTIVRLRERAPLVDALRAHGAALLSAYAGVGNARGIAHLVALGIPVSQPLEADGYWGIARGATALHVAAWRHRPEAVRALLTLGADVHLRDDRGRTPLMEAVRACVASYWQDRATPAVVELLLAAGASPHEVTRPTGRDDVDHVLRAARA